MQNYADTDEVEWGLTHAFFANMGGFVLTQKCGERASDGEKSPRRQQAEDSGVIQKDVEKEASEHEPTEIAPIGSSDSKIKAHDFHTPSGKYKASGNEKKPRHSPQDSSDEISPSAW